MKTRKIYIEYQFRQGPYGGANQFLKCLRDYFVRQGIYAGTAKEADFILVNHTNISKETLAVKKEHPEKIVIHRMDGPVSKHRKRSKALDKQSFYLDRILCNGTIFQSQWTKESCLETGYRKTAPTAVIHNAPDPQIFNRTEQKRRGENLRQGENIPDEAGRTRTVSGKIRLIATSWSPNWNKGFDVLQYLDEHLDFNRYEVTFVGNSPIEFKNFHHIPAQNSVDLAKTLREHDIYLAVSRSESCSNSLLEAINSGLAVVARDSGCYREVTGEGGIIVQTAEEFPEAIEKLADNLESYQGKLPFFDIEEIGRAYCDFMNRVAGDLENGRAQIKVLTGRKIFCWKCYCFYIKIYQRIVRMIEKGR